MTIEFEPLEWVDTDDPQGPATLADPKMNADTLNAREQLIAALVAQINALTADAGQTELDLAAKADLTGPGGTVPDGQIRAATTTTRGLARLMGGTADAPTVPATALTGTIDDARIPAGVTRDSELAAAVSGIVAGAPGALDTLDELAAAFGDDPNAIATITAALAVRLRVDVVQSLTSGQRQQGRDNLGLGGAATYAPAGLPVSTAQQAALDEKLDESAPIPWALLTGKPCVWVDTLTGAAIQSAIASLGAGGGTVYLRAGSYALTTPITLPSNVTLQGQGMYATVLAQATAGADAIAGTDLSHVAVRDLHLAGPNTARTGTAGSGINFGLSGTQGNATFYVELRNVFVTDFGLDGVFISTPIVSELSRVIVFKAGRHGINLVGNVGLESAGTSTQLKACFAAGCYGAGLRLKQMAYSSLSACAADANGVGYEYDTCTGITESGCGSEEPYNFTAKQSGYSGLSRRLINSKVTFTSPYMIGNVGTAFQVGTNSQVVATNLFEGSPGNPDEPTNNPTASVKVDSGASVVLIKPSVVTAMNLASSTTTILPDAIGSGGGSSYTDEQAQDAAAQMILAGAHQGASAAYDDPAGALAIIVTPPFLTGVGAYTHDAYGGTLGNNQSTVALNGYFTPIRVYRTETWDQIAVVCQTAGTTGALLRAGIYADDGSGRPAGAPLLDAGTVAATTTGNLTWTINRQMTPGLYHVVFKVEGSPTTGPKLQGFTTQAAAAAQPAPSTGPGAFVTYGADGALTTLPTVGQASFRPVGSARVASRP